MDKDNEFATAGKSFNLKEFIMQHAQLIKGNKCGKKQKKITHN